MKNFPIIPSILFTIIFTNNLICQSNYYSKVIYGELNNSIQAYDISKTADGGYILAGSGELFGGNALVIKIDSAGNPVSNNSYFSSQPMCFYDIANTHDSAFILGGKIDNIEHNNWDIFLIKRSNSKGNFWIKNFTIDEQYDSHLTSIIQTSDSGFVICGYTYEFDKSPYHQILAIKIDLDGNLQWSKKLYAGNKENKAFSIKEMDNGEYILCGYYNTISNQNTKALIVNLSEDGNINWAKSYFIEDQENSNSSIYDIDVSNNLTTALMSLNGSSALMRINSSGVVSWTKDYNTSSQYYGQAPRLHKTTDNNFLFVSGSFEGKYFKTNNSGTILQSGELMLNPEDIIEINNKGLFALGNGPITAVKNNKAAYDNIGIITIDSLGNSENCVWPASSSYNSISVTNTPIDIISENTGYDRYQVFNQTSGYPAVRDGCVDIIGSLDDPYNIDVEVFPNPNSGIFNLKLSEYSEGIISITNNTGQTIYRKKYSGNSILIDLNHINTGVYHFVVQSNKNYTANGKILIHN